MLGIYIHIPFCKKRCPFCDFSVSTKDPLEKMDHYTEKIILEIQSGYAHWSHFSQIDTIFFGGGTPSLVQTKHIEKILTALSQKFNFAPNIEISIECNPDDIDGEKVSNLLTAGINRFSLGAQSFDDVFLKKLGRIHQSKDIKRSIDAFTQNHVENWSLDLMFGLPEQDLAHWEKTLEKAMRFQSPHISTYELTFEKGTKFYKDLEVGKIIKSKDAIVAAQFTCAKEMLTKASYKPYETSNAAKNGYQSKHNLACWKGHAYWGLGVSAHSRWIGPDTYARIENPKNYEIYMQTSQQDFTQKKYWQPMSIEEYTQECLFTGLRLRDGIQKETWDAHIKNLDPGVKTMQDQLVEDQMLCISKTHVRLSNKAWVLADNIALKLLAGA